MSLLSQFIWIWTISFIICLYWFIQGEGKKLIKTQHDEKYFYFDFEFYKIIVYSAIFIMSPFAAFAVITTYIRGWTIIGYKKILLRIMISKLENKEVKKELRKKIKEVKLNGIRKIF